MAAIQFPNNPNTGDIFTATNGIKYTFDGEKWKTIGTANPNDGEFIETPKILNVDKVLAANSNVGAVGLMEIGSDSVLTIPPTSTFRTLIGKTGSGSGSSTEKTLAIALIFS